MQLVDNPIKISIVLPNYNSGNHISKAINSFLAQDYPHKELIIVDAKSTDNSHEIINNYVETNINIKWVKEEDVNVTDAINIGLRHCTGDFCAFLAADVFYYGNDIFSTIAKNYDMLQFDVIYFDYYCYYPEQKKTILTKCPNIEFTKSNLIKYGTIAGFDNVFIARKVYEKYNYNIHYNLVSDWEFFLRISQDNLNFLYVEKVCTVNVQDGNNLSLKYHDDQLRQVKEVISIYNTDSLFPFFININGQSSLNRIKIRFKRKIHQLFKGGYRY